MSIFHVGDLGPSGYSMDIVPGDSGLDMSLVSAAEFRVKKNDGTIIVWAGSMSNQTTTTLTVTYIFSTLTSPVDKAGHWSIYCALTIPTGIARTFTDVVEVKDTYE